MRRRLSRIIQVFGEGALAGVVVGGTLGACRISLNEDLAHGMLWLAAGRLPAPVLVWAAWGIAFSCGLALLFTAWSRLGRPGRSALLLMVLAGALAAVMVGRARVLSLLGLLIQGHFPRAFLDVLALSAAGLLGLRLLDMVRDRVAAPSNPPRRSLRTVAAGCGIGAGALVALWGLSLPLLDAGRAAGHRSVILISLDTLRGDRLGVLGCQRGLTPRLDALGREGIVFEEAVAPAPWTLPSHVSLFTSRLPFGHGVWTEKDHIEPRRILLAERFRQAGYRTAAFTGGGFVSSAFGFGQGFETYREFDETFGRSSEPIFAAALDWIRRIRGAPFFLFVHTYAVHAPFTHAEFADPANAGRLPGAYRLRWMKKMGLRGHDLTPTERRFVRDLYDGDVAYADGLVGELIEGVESAGLMDQVLWVVVSDHGEDLWDHDEEESPGHGRTLYQDVLHVPLILRGPGLVPAGVRVPSPVSLIDVAPTLLDLAALPGDSDYRGISLRRRWAPGAGTEPRTIYSEGVQKGLQKMAARREGEKVIITLAPGGAGGQDPPVTPLSIEAYALRSDPGELHDLYPEEPESSAELLNILLSRARRVVTEHTEQRSQPGALPEDLLQKLRSLGYLQ